MTKELNQKLVLHYYSSRLALKPVPELPLTLTIRMQTQDFSILYLTCVFTKCHDLNSANFINFLKIIFLFQHSLNKNTGARLLLDAENLGFCLIISIFLSEIQSSFLYCAPKGEHHKLTNKLQATQDSSTLNSSYSTVSGEILNLQRNVQSDLFDNLPKHSQDTCSRGGKE